MNEIQLIIKYNRKIALQTSFYLLINKSINVDAFMKNDTLTIRRKMGFCNFLYKYILFLNESDLTNRYEMTH